MRTVKIDAKDRQLLYELDTNCRRSLTYFAKKLKLSVPAVAYRIKRLQKLGVILGFFATVDASFFGQMTFDVWFELSNANILEKQKFLDHLEKNPEVIWLVECGGKFDCAICILAPDVSSFYTKLRKVISGFENIIENKHLTIAKQIWNTKRTYLSNDSSISNRNEEITLSGTRKRIKLNNLEKSILRILGLDARKPVLQIAHELGVSPITVKSKIKKLEKEVLTGYKTSIQASLLELQTYEVLVSTTHANEEHEKQMVNYCLSDPYSTIVLLTVGEWDLNFAFDAENKNHSQEILNKFRSTFAPIIKSYELIPIIKVRKTSLPYQLQ